MKQELETIFDDIKSGHTQEDVQSNISEAVYDFVDDGWEEDFDDEHAAYAETGRGEAESDIITDLINVNGGRGLSIDDHCELFDAIAEHYDISVN